MDSGETKAGRKKEKEKNVSFDNAAISPFRPLFPPPPTSNSPRRLFLFFFSFSFRFSRQLGSFERPPPPPRRNVPIFPVFLEEEEDRRLAKERGGRIRGEKDPGRSGIAIGRKRKRWKRCPHRYIL